MTPERWFELRPSGDGWTLHLHGEWRLAQLPALDAACAAAAWPRDGRLTLDAAGMTGLDSSGVMLLYNRLTAAGVAWAEVELVNFSDADRRLLRLVTERLMVEVPSGARRMRGLARLGAFVVRRLGEIPGQFAFLGRIGTALVDVAAHPARFRGREFVVQLEAVGLRALPIVGLMTFLIGVVFAYLLGIQIEKYGANIFIVDGVALAVARELSPLLTAVLLAGRSGAAFTAQIGAMKVTEEIDAISTLGLSPVQVLVVPRLLAIVIAMPLLAFAGDVMGILGAAVVAASQLDITLYTFVARLKEVLPLKSVLYGLAKTPAYAAAIAFIACRNGFAVSRDARSVGERTTATVVTSLVAVILINAAFAIAFPEIK